MRVVGYKQGNQVPSLSTNAQAVAVTNASFIGFRRPTTASNASIALQLHHPSQFRVHKTAFVGNDQALSVRGFNLTTFHLSDTNFTANSFPVGGSAMEVSLFGNDTHFSRCLVANNSYSNGSAVVFRLHAPLSLSLNQLQARNNLGALGGAVHLYSPFPSQVHFNQTLWVNNTGVQGGAIYVHPSSSPDLLVNVLTSYFSDNRAQEGAAIYHVSTASLLNNTETIPCVSSSGIQLTCNSTDGIHFACDDNQVHVSCVRPHANATYLICANTSLPRCNINGTVGPNPPSPPSPPSNTTICGVLTGCIPLNNMTYACFNGSVPTVCVNVSSVYTPLLQCFANNTYMGNCTFNVSSPVHPSLRRHAKGRYHFFANESQRGVVLTNTSVHNHTSTQTGAVHSDRVTILTSSFVDNRGEYGGALFASRARHVLVASSMFARNRANVHGGAVYLDDDTRSFNTSLDGLLIRNSDFVNNTAMGKGGAVYATTQCQPLTVSNSSLERNVAWEGGAMQIDTSMNVLLNVTRFVNNSGMSGAALSVRGTRRGSNDNLLTFSNLTITNNTVLPSPGTPRNYAAVSLLGVGAVDLTQSEIRWNKAPGGVGGVALDDIASIFFSDNVWANNTAVGSPGAVAFFKHPPNTVVRIVRDVFGLNGAVALRFGVNSTRANTTLIKLGDVSVSVHSILDFSAVEDGGLGLFGRWVALEYNTCGTDHTPLMYTQFQNTHVDPGFLVVNSWNQGLVWNVSSSTPAMLMIACIFPHPFHNHLTHSRVIQQWSMTSKAITTLSHTAHVICQHNCLLDGLLVIERPASARGELLAFQTEQGGMLVGQFGQVLQVDPRSLEACPASVIYSPTAVHVLLTPCL